MKEYDFLRKAIDDGIAEVNSSGTTGHLHGALDLVARHLQEAQVEVAYANRVFDAARAKLGSDAQAFAILNWTKDQRPLAAAKAKFLSDLAEKGKRALDEPRGEHL